MHYMQQAMIHMTLNLVNLRAELDQVVKAITILVLEDAEPMDQEWTRSEPKVVINLIKDFEAKAEKGKLVPKTPEIISDKKVREERAGSLPPPTLLHRNSSDKHSDPVKWYEAHHPKIDLAAAQRLPGGTEATLDPEWLTWSVFVESLRASFATQVGRDQAVNQWQELKDTDSIDDFLDRLISLMWSTSYIKEVVKDKLIRGLNKEVVLAWA